VNRAVWPRPLQRFGFRDGLRSRSSPGAPTIDEQTRRLQCRRHTCPGSITRSRTVPSSARIVSLRVLSNSHRAWRLPARRARPAASNSPAARSRLRPIRSCGEAHPRRASSRARLSLPSASLSVGRGREIGGFGGLRSARLWTTRASIHWYRRRRASGLRRAR